MFENLENRQLLSTTLSSGLLTIAGTAGNDMISAGLTAAGKVWVSDNGALSQFDQSIVSKIIINTFDGNDVITVNPVLTKPMEISAGAGNDFVQSGGGNDSIWGGDGADNLRGMAGNDVIFGGKGNDSMLGGAGDDVMHGNAGSDVIYGEAGNDKCYGEGWELYKFVKPLVFNLKPVLQRVPIVFRPVNGLRGAIASTLPQATAIVRPVAPVTRLPNLVVKQPIIELATYNDIIAGGDGDDELHGNQGNDTMFGHAGNDRMWGDEGNDNLFGAEGNDRMYGGAGADLVYGGSGNDTIIAIDNATTDSVYGESGNDSFWVDEDPFMVFFSVSDKIGDASAAEAKNVHRVRSFANGPDRTLDGDAITDPADGANYKNFSDRPLFASSGPSEADVLQGSLGDCWLVAGMGALARTSTNSVQQLVTELGDGTYAVQLGGKFYRVDGHLPTASATSTDLVFAKQGREGSIWAPIVEKAYTYHRAPAKTYGSISGGLGRESLPGLGGWNSGDKYFNTYASNQALLDDIAAKLGSGLAMTMGFDSVPAGSSAIAGHEYTVMRVNRNAAGTVVSVTIRNPWGWDGAGNDGNTADALITLTGAQVRATAGSIAWANVA